MIHIPDLLGDEGHGDEGRHAASVAATGGGGAPEKGGEVRQTYSGKHVVGILYSTHDNFVGFSCFLITRYQGMRPDVADYELTH